MWILELTFLNFASSVNKTEKNQFRTYSNKSLKSSRYLDRKKSCFHTIKTSVTTMGINNRQMSNVRETRPDTRLPQSLAGAQGPYFRSPDHLGRSSEVKIIK